jgi:protein SCO1/2
MVTDMTTPRRYRTLYLATTGALLFLNLLTIPVNAAQLVTSTPPAGGDFHLYGTGQQQLSLQDFRGKLVLLYFGYTTCPDICPTNLANLAHAMKLLSPEEQAQVQVLMITVDPERDTQDKLDTYLPYFHHNFKGLTGNENTIKKVADQYGAVYQKAAIGEGALGYAVDHSAFTYLINQEGKLIQQLPHATSGEVFAQTIRLHLVKH